MNIETLFNATDLSRFYFPAKLLWGVDARWRVPDLLDGLSDVGMFVDAAFEGDDFVAHVRTTLGSRLAFTEVCTRTPEAKHLEALAGRLSAPAGLLSVGGGSTIDAAKAVMARWLYGTFDSVGMGARRGMVPAHDGRRPLLVGVPTTAGTGADASRYYVTYDGDTGAKIHGKSWRLVADWIVLDPAFLRSAPADLMVKSAFDAFVHAFETFVCRQERSWCGDMLALDVMPRIMRSLDRALYQNARDDDTLLELLYASAVAGIGISNIRTGNIHEAAGALVERCRLSHPETLMVFFRSAYSQYRAAIADRETLLMRRFACDAPELGLSDFDAVIQWWDRAFGRVGLAARIAATMAELASSAGALRAHVFERVHNDRVWCGKESPVPLDEPAIHEFIDAAFASYGLHD